MRGNSAEFVETAFVQQQLDALTRRQLAALVLLVNTLLTAAEFRFFALLAQCLKLFLRSFHVTRSFWIDLGD